MRVHCHTSLMLQNKHSTCAHVCWRPVTRQRICTGAEKYNNHDNQCTSTIPPHSTKGTFLLVMMWSVCPNVYAHNHGHITSHSVAMWVRVGAGIVWQVVQQEHVVHHRVLVAFTVRASGVRATLFTPCHTNTCSYFARRQRRAKSS